MNFKKTWKRFMNMSRSREGFTLVELIVVIAILAILAGVAIPVYSGYISKANEAADQQLLAAVNTAFGAACIENKTNASAFKDGEVTFNIAQMEPSEFAEDFAFYFAGNGKFKTITALEFKGGVFVKAGDDSSNSSTTSIWTEFFNNLGYTSDSTEVKAVQDSTFGTIGAAGLLGQVNTATDFASDFAGDSSAFADFLMGNQVALAAGLGYNLENEKDAEAFYAYYNAMVAQKSAEIDPENPDSDSAINQAQYELMANYAVLEAAKNTTGETKDLLADLQAGMTVEELKGMMKDDTQAQQGLAKAAMYYGMYTAYANTLTGEEKENALAKTNSIDGILGDIGNPSSGFNAYLKDPDSSAETDLKGYLSAMQIISSSTYGNETATSDLMLNGYTDPELLAGLTALLGK